jgi:ribosomal protein S18 acetylase RimI-like enzyme
VASSHAIFTVRAARPEDALSVARVHVRAWQAAYRGLLPDEHLDRLSAQERAAKYTFDSTDQLAPRTLLALAGDATVGFAAFGASRDEDASGAGELFALYVDPPYWGRGAGRLLLAQVRAQLLERGFHQAVLWVLVDNDSAQRFYHADGWRRDNARRREDVWGVEVEVTRYRRPLP